MPWTWVEATAPGGRIVCPWGRLVHLALTVAADGLSASGWVQGMAQFMADRTAPAPPTAGRAGYNAVRGDGPAASEHRIDRDLAPIEGDWNLRFALRVAVPDAMITTGRDEEGINARIHDGRSSWASFSAVGDGTTVLHQGGGRRIGDELMTAWTAWEDLDRPEPWDFGVTVTPERQWAWLHTPDSELRWPIYEAAAAASR
ncbi:hypothetical protein [Streptomyces sp. TLI_053]|uniref:hypothetical protein n=1 Tax=Streptomyces sp. TLI_053 TaxID=1855352 RepID=UPI000A7B8CD1|nr:hypothetical protein [Streptomyces sp. TLI_053]